jgi:asparagine N-glycosylation enzyme membrane subunit Stt3
MQSGEFGDTRYKLYSIKPGASWGTTFGQESTYPYFIDAAGDTTGHPISEDTYKAIQFLRNKEGNKVIAWWDYELEIKAAGKEPVISYASEDIKLTIARPASLYDKFEPNEKVADVSRFFATDSEDVAKGIAEKYGANIVYISRQRMNELIPVMLFTANPDFYAQNQDSKSQEDFFNKFIKPSIGYKFNSGAELKYFNKIFENKDVYIYQLK